MSKNENAQNARVLRDDELDAVSGGYTLSNTMISGYAVSRDFLVYTFGTVFVES